MKKLFSRYQTYMFHPILYKTVTRVSVVAVLMLLWDRFVSDGTFTMWQAPGFLLGVVLLCWAWVDYADERIVSFEELEPEDRTFCSLLSNLVLGVPLVVIALIAGAL